MLELVNRMRVDPDAEVYRLRNMTWGDTESPQPSSLNEGITSNFLTSHDLVLTAPAGGALMISGAIGGSGGLAKTGLGLLVLSSSNSYAGGTTVSAGTLEVVDRWALPNETSMTIAAGAALIFDPSTAAGSPLDLSTASPAMVQAVPETSTITRSMRCVLSLTAASGRPTRTCLAKPLGEGRGEGCQNRRLRCPRRTESGNRPLQPPHFGMELGRSQEQRAK